MSPLVENQITTAADTRTLRPLPPRVRDALIDLAKRYHRIGVQVFLFGSVARSWPLAAATADFDIGFEFRDGRVDEQVARTLAREFDNLPTVRPVDLVDFSRVSPEFRREAFRDTVALWNEA